jgi:hypothetical protein
VVTREPRKPRRAAVLAITAALGLLAIAPAIARAATPRLGAPWRNLPGFGAVKPSTISFGGDPTSLVGDIRWTSWGPSQAIGYGESDWVWPGTCTGCNKPSPARVVAFDLGTCHGRRSYNAFEWYFPEYGDTFKPGDYSNTCTHRGVDREPAPPTMNCPQVQTPAGQRTEYLSVAGVTCAQAAAVIDAVPTGPFAHEQRLQIDGYRCGTEGDVLQANPVSEVWSCETPTQAVTYTLVY